METYVAPPINLTKGEMIQKLRDAGNKMPDNMPESQVDDLYRNRFHGPDLPLYYETVVDGKLYPKWKAPKPAAQPSQEPAEEPPQPEPPIQDEQPAEQTEGQQ